MQKGHFAARPSYLGGVWFVLCLLILPSQLPYASGKAKFQSVYVEVLGTFLSVELAAFCRTGSTSLLI